ncbi:hypothetical protein ACM1RC_19240 [Paenibacillus azoreducens]|uniref:hypothetical protein n=1 Tax=Paenibacillus azoreducens TaxID=116718 RepID=UPI0039F5FB0D
MLYKDLYLKEYNAQHWMEFVELYRDEYLLVNAELREKAGKSRIPEDICMVLLPEMGDYLFTWIEKSVPALGSDKPSDYLNNDDGIKALKAMIMRMPR